VKQKCETILKTVKQNMSTGDKAMKMSCIPSGARFLRAGAGKIAENARRK